jgi:hypothetical protein
VRLVDWLHRNRCVLLGRRGQRQQFARQPFAALTELQILACKLGTDGLGVGVVQVLRVDRLGLLDAGQTFAKKRPIIRPGQCVAQGCDTAT